MTAARRIQEILSSHPKSSRWLTQTDVENDPKLNLQPGSIRTFYERLARRISGKNVGEVKQIKARIIRQQLEAKGVYRERGLQCPKRIWWLAFVGEGGAKPRFDIREQEHLFVEADPVEEAVAQGAPRRLSLEGASLGRATPEAEGGVSADLPREKGGQEDLKSEDENAVLNQG